MQSQPHWEIACLTAHSLPSCFGFVLLLLHPVHSCPSSSLVRGWGSKVRVRSPLAILPLLCTLCLLSLTASCLAWDVDGALHGLVWELCFVASHCSCRCLSQLHIICFVLHVAHCQPGIAASRSYQAYALHTMPPVQLRRTKCPAYAE